MQCERPGLDPCVGKIPWRRHGNTLQYSYLENPHGQRRLVGYSPWNSPGQNTRVGRLSLPRGSSQTRDWNQVSFIAGGILHQLNHQGSEWLSTTQSFWVQKGAILCLFKELYVKSSDWRRDRPSYSWSHVLDKGAWILYSVLTQEVFYVNGHV